MPRQKLSIRLSERFHTLSLRRRGAMVSTLCRIIMPPPGRKFFHSHIHVIPRFEGDQLRFASIHKEYNDFDEMGAMAESIKANL